MGCSQSSPTRDGKSVGGDGSEAGANGIPVGNASNSGGAHHPPPATDALAPRHGGEGNSVAGTTFIGDYATDAATVTSDGGATAAVAVAVAAGADRAVPTPQPPASPAAVTPPRGLPSPHGGGGGDAAGEPAGSGADAGAGRGAGAGSSVGGAPRGTGRDIVLQSFAMWTCGQLLDPPVSGHPLHVELQRAAHSFLLRLPALTANLSALANAIWRRLDASVGGVCGRPKRTFTKYCLRVPSVAVIADSLLSEFGRLSVTYFLSFPWTSTEQFYTLNKPPPQCLSSHSVRMSANPLASPVPALLTDAPAAMARKRWRRAITLVVADLAVKRLVFQRQFVTLLEQLRAVGADDVCYRPAARRGPHRQPVMLMLGGGMGAGKSTVVQLLKSDERYARMLKNAVIVEADAFKTKDPLFARRHELEATPEVDANIHHSSTDAAEQLLLAALSRQRDVVFDGTMAWAPFVAQTMAMVRHHEELYEKGPGYVMSPDGDVVEQYWQVVTDDARRAALKGTLPVPVEHRVPYRVEMVGVTCAPEVAVARALSRYLITDRPVPLASQLRSHAQFASNFGEYAALFDRVLLYDTTAPDEPPTLVAQKFARTEALTVAHPHLMAAFERLPSVNPAATEVTALHCRHNDTDAGAVAAGDHGPPPTPVAVRSVRWFRMVQQWQGRSDTIRRWFQLCANS